MRKYHRNSESVTEEDQKRIADKINEKYKIEDQESYDKAYDDYLRKESWIDKSNKEKTFQQYLKSNNIPLTKRRQVAINSRLKKGEKPSRKMVKGKAFNDKPKKAYKYNILAKKGDKTVYARRIKVDAVKKRSVKTKTKKGNIVTRTKYFKTSRYVYIDRTGKRVKKL